MTGPGCDEVRALAPELALGVLAGTERAAALGHLAACDGCRERVAELAAVADGLLLLAPTVEPPPGFESRVLDRLHGEGDGQVAAPAGRRARRVLAGAVAAVALVVVGVVGGLAAGSRGGGELAAAPMEDPSGEAVGDVFLYDGDPAWLMFTIDGWRTGDGVDPVEYLVRVDLVDGRQVTLDGVSISGGDGAWGSVLDVDPDDVRWVGVVDRTGRVYCGARFADA